MWHLHDVGTRLTDTDKRIVHGSLGVIEVQCQTLLDPNSVQALLVYTAVPGTPDHEKLAMLAAFADRASAMWPLRRPEGMHQMPRIVASQRLREMISFMISVVPP